MESTSAPGRASPGFLVLPETQRLDGPKLNISQTQGERDSELIFLDLKKIQKVCFFLAHLNFGQGRFYFSYHCAYL